MRTFLGIILSVTISVGYLPAQDKLRPLAEAHLEGRVGQWIDSCIQNGVMGVDYHLYSVPFLEKTDRGGGFQGEFWGKWFTSAALAVSYHPAEDYLKILEESVGELLSAQEKNGRISSYPREETFLNWDIWGRKYVLLGLVDWYDLTGEKKAIKAAAAMLDELIEIAGPGKQKLTETGLRILGSMSSTSILEPVVLVYQRTGEQRYLDFAEFLVSLWSEPNSFTATGMRLVEDAIAGVPPVRISAPKAYEAMSCYEGLCELYRSTSNQLYLDAALAYAHALIEREIMIVGSGSSAELWCDGAYRQTGLLEQPMETCVTTTWIKFCYQLLRLTGDPSWADQMEISLYNSLAGSMNSRGDWWAYFSPLAGERMPSPVQIPQCQSSCCVANGPRALLLTPEWSVMNSETGPVFNLYSQGTWKTLAPDGTSLQFRQTSSYPVSGEVSIEVGQSAPSDYEIAFRIPQWSRQSKLEVNGTSYPCPPGSYARINRKWNAGDRISLKLDMRGRILSSPGGVNHKAVMRGPIVLALDNRMVQPADYNLWLFPEGSEWQEVNELGGLTYVLPDTVGFSGQDQFIELKPVHTDQEDVWMAFEAPFLYRYTHFFDHEIRPLILCDFASAGNRFSNENLYRTWLPQPLYMQEIYPEDTWRILYRRTVERPEFPAFLEH